MRILLLNDTRAHPNWGAQATPVALDSVLRAGLDAYDPVWLSWGWLRSKHRIFRSPLPRRAWEPARHPRIRGLLNRVSVPAEYFPRVADDFDFFADQWIRGEGGPMAARFLDELSRTAVLVYNGENSLYCNTVEGMRALFLLWVSKTRVGKPTCIVNHTAHLTGTLPRLNAMVRKVHPVLDLVTCREAASFSLLRTMGITGVELVPDVVFWLREDPTAAERIAAWSAGCGLTPGKYVCLSASGLPASQPRGAWDGEYAFLVRAVRERTGLTPVLVARDPHCQFLAEVARRTGSVFFGPEHDFRDLWPLMRQSAVLVTGHFHYAIIAASVGCPFVPLTGNNHKMNGLCEMLEWEPGDPFDITDLAACRGAITDRVSILTRRRSDFSAQLSRKAEELRAMVGGLPGRIQQAAEKRS